ncbi:MAG: SDR family NAD(P)-dependent oxidoreductase [Clostridia bacterium]|nr:SDR family NAD(P)-dependent oxidoreductase [Clostridia bacterium]
MDSYTLITGATGGLGQEFCRQCAARGDNLLLTGRSEQKLEDLRAELLKSYSVKILTFACRLDDELERQSLCDFVAKAEVKLSQFISVAGVDTQMAFERYTREKVLFQLRVNFEAAVALTHALLSFRAEGFSILVVSSISGSCPMPYFALYSATKSALVSFFSALRVELKDKGVKVTVLMPGSIPTRPDIIEDIKIQGLKGRLSSKPKDFVVKKALAGARKNKRIVIPGAFNKFVYFLTKITPYRLVAAFVARGWKNKEKDAFSAF